MNTIFIQRVNLPLYRLIMKLTEGSFIGRGCFRLNKCVQRQKILCLTQERISSLENWGELTRVRAFSKTERFSIVRVHSWMYQSNRKPTREFESARDTPRTHESRRGLTWICGSLKEQIKQFDANGSGEQNSSENSFERIQTLRRQRLMI